MRSPRDSGRPRSACAATGEGRRVDLLFPSGIATARSENPRSSAELAGEIDRARPGSGSGPGVRRKLSGIRLSGHKRRARLLRSSFASSARSSGTSRRHLRRASTRTARGSRARPIPSSAIAASGVNPSSIFSTESSFMASPVIRRDCPRPRLHPEGRCVPRTSVTRSISGSPSEPLSWSAWRRALSKALRRSSSQALRTST